MYAKVDAMSHHNQLKKLKFKERYSLYFSLLFKNKINIWNLKFKIQTLMLNKYY